MFSVLYGKIYYLSMDMKQYLSGTQAVGLMMRVVIIYFTKQIGRTVAVDHKDI